MSWLSNISLFLRVMSWPSDLFYVSFVPCPNCLAMLQLSNLYMFSSSNTLTIWHFLVSLKLCPNYPNSLYFYFISPKSLANVFIFKIWHFLAVLQPKIRPRHLEVILLFIWDIWLKKTSNMSKIKRMTSLIYYLLNWPILDNITLLNFLKIKFASHS